MFEDCVIRLCDPTNICDDLKNIKDNKELFKLLNMILGYDINFNDYLGHLCYKEFLQTPYWKIISEWVKDKADYKCEICSSSVKLNAHHRTYSRHCQEHIYWEDDILCLCQKCHELFHKNSKLMEYKDE